MSKTGSKSYDPASTEKRIWEFWEKGGYFHPTPDERGRDKRFCIMIPLPNVTAALHLGHALNNTLQDILTRLKRMQGCNTLWMMGTDHAGIATQATVEKAIFEREGKNRHDLGREELVRRIWDWKHRFGGRIIEQLKLMGCSGDYKRERFTLDEGCAKAVRHTFFKLFRDGLIYRGKRLVNWDTQLHTAVADDEVYHETIQGHFWHFKYPVIDPRPGEPAFVHIATTRPETMLGDTAVAVHPEPDVELNRVEAEWRAKLAGASEKEKPDVQAALDDLAGRRQTLLPTLLKLRDMAKDGRKVTLPLVDRPIPLICDEWAKPEMGSGCVKITPAHDANDYDVGQRHDLAMINVMTEDGKIARIIEPDGSVNPNSEKYEGLTFATEGRKRVVADLEALGLVERIEDHVVEIGHSDRSKTAIEPFLSDQWFVRMGDLTEAEAATVQSSYFKNYWKTKNLPEPRASARAAVRTGEGPQHAREYPGLCQIAMDAVKRGEVRFFPPRYEKTYMDWLTEKRDWCISRQLWWGHRIPVWTKRLHLTEDNWIDELMPKGIDSLLEGKWASKGNQAVQIVDSTRGNVVADWKNTFNPVVPETEGDYVIHACLQHDEKDVLALLADAGFEQDPDVLDTWFSSALWPHSTLNWPDEDPNDETSLLGYFYPGNVLITAREIITLWVARMVMTGLYNIGDIPFSDVIIHSVIQDGQGRKMSKTLGNGVDPQDIIDEYGADALRFTLADLATETQDIRLPVEPKKLPDGRTINISEKFEKGRNFCNKLWQVATGFVIPNLDGYSPEPLDAPALRLEDRWILSRMTACIEDLNGVMERYRFSEAMKILYRFMWDEYCSWYVEMSKSRLSGSDRASAQQVLVFVLDQLLRMLHPFVPFVTEAVWEKLNAAAPRRGLRTMMDGERALTVAAWPEADAALRDARVESEMACLHTIIKSVREIRADVNTHRSRNKHPSMRTLPAVIIRAEAAKCQLVDTYRAFVMPLAGCDSLHAGPDAAKPRGAMSRVEGNLEVYVPVDGLTDLDEVRRTEGAKLGELRKAKERAEKQLANENFARRADPAVVAQTRQRAEDLSGQIRLTEQHLADLE
ncbi:MAG: valine--tRNA ligase [Phycisphaerae bacterium]|nr:valine--tRNA ligase [Phycisphaerae bacterium]